MTTQQILIKDPKHEILKTSQFLDDAGEAFGSAHSWILCRAERCPLQLSSQVFRLLDVDEMVEIFYNILKYMAKEFGDDTIPMMDESCERHLTSWAGNSGWSPGV